MLQNPRDQLLNKTLKDGWIVTEKLEKKQGDSGGNFGTCYIARRNDIDIAFVKAIDYISAFMKGNTADELLKITREFDFEKEILDYCTQKGMTKVISFYGHDEIYPDGHQNPFSKVSCLIMEAGEKDLRRLVNTDGAGVNSGFAWNLFICSDVAMAISELHKAGIAHQDIKPSNIIATQNQGKNTQQAVFSGNNIKNRQNVKVGDLGRVLKKDQSSPFNSYKFPGDLRYKPIEHFYHYILNEWVDCRESADAYMLGSLIFYLYTGISIQSIIFNYIPPEFHPDNWNGSYEENLLPILVSGTTRAIHDQLLPSIPQNIKTNLSSIVVELLNPNPKLRGDRNSRQQIGRPVGIDRIHQRIHSLALRAAAFERGSLARV